MLNDILSSPRYNYLFFVIHADEKFAKATKWCIMANIIVDNAVIMWLVNVVGVCLSSCHKIFIDLSKDDEDEEKNERHSMKKKSKTPTQIRHNLG